MFEDLSNEKLLQEIEEIEKQEKKMLSPNSRIRTTNEVATLSKGKFDLNDKNFIIKRNLKLDLLFWVVTFCLIFGAMAYGIFNNYTNKNSNISGVVVLFFLILSFSFIGYKNLTLKSLTLLITFTTKDLTINNEIFRWLEIKKTYCINRYPGKTSKNSFVIGMKNGEIHYFNIGNQLGFKYDETDFSKIVEHYKSLSKLSIRS